MDNEELIKQIKILTEENERLKKQLENYRKSYYEKNKESTITNFLIYKNYLEINK